MEEKIELTCPHCGIKVRAPVSLVGKKARCPKCKNVVDVIAPKPEPEPEPVAEFTPLPEEEQPAEEPKPKQKEQVAVSEEGEEPAASEQEAPLEEGSEEQPAPARPATGSRFARPAGRVATGAGRVSRGGFRGTAGRGAEIAPPKKKKKWLKRFIFLIILGGLGYGGYYYYTNYMVEPPDYFPLKTGYKRTYSVAYKSKIMPEVKAELTSKVGKKEKVGEVECFVLEDSIVLTATITGKEGKSESKTYLAVSKEGIKIHKLNEKTFDTPSTLIKYPLKKDSEWEASLPISLFGIFTEFNLKLKCEGEEDIEVEGKSYKCFKITGKDEEKKTILTIWTAKDVGIVKIEGDIDGSTLSVELKKK